MPTPQTTATRTRRYLTAGAVALALVTSGCQYNDRPPTPAAAVRLGADWTPARCSMVAPDADSAPAALRGLDYSPTTPEYGTWTTPAGDVIGYAAAEDAIVWSLAECAEQMDAYCAPVTSGPIDGTPADCTVTA